jgi:ribose transport system permease protein
MSSPAVAGLALKQKLAQVELTTWASVGRVVALIVLCVAIGGFSDVFFTERNISLTLTNACVLIILGVGETFTIITCGPDGPDLSVGSIMTITAVVAALMAKAGIFFGFAFGVSLLFGAALGLVNGLLIARGGLPPFIATYGLQWAVFGFAYVILKGYVVYDFGADFRFIGNANLFGILPMPVVVMVTVVVAGFVLLRKTTLGRRFYAVGANADAAYMSGIDVARTTLIAFVLSGFLAALAGLVFVARTNAVQADIGAQYLLTAIAVVFMGGSGIGGQGGVIGTVVGALIMTVVTNAMDLYGVPGVWRNAIIGALIIVTVLLELQLKRKIVKTN